MNCVIFKLTVTPTDSPILLLCSARNVQQTEGAAGIKKVPISL